VGLADDPDRQRVTPVRWHPRDGSVVVTGSAGSGVSSTLHTLATTALADPDTRVYALTASRSRVTSLAHHPRCIVVEVSQRERTMRLLKRVRDDLGQGPLVLVVDDLQVVQRALDDLDTARELDTLTQLLTTERPGTVVLVGCDRPSAVPPALLARCAHRWVLHLHDALDAGVMGVPARNVPGPVPGRAFMAETGLGVQLVEPGPTPFHDASTPRLAPVEATPARVASVGARADRVDGATRLPVGPSLDGDDICRLELPEGDHLLVLGGARTGRSTALARLASAWREAHDGRVVAVLPRRSLPVRAVADMVATSVAELAIDDHGPLLVLVDDAELVDDPTGALAALASGRRPERTVMVAGRPDALRQSYGHWSSVVRRSRLGLVAAGGGDLDGDLLATALPRRTPVDPRPGLMWVVQQGTVELAQVALAVDHTSIDHTSIDHTSIDHTSIDHTAIAHAASASATMAATSASVWP
jgi:S-DNA-T family DNA segregation ATPase FtsK/SpoIIIE